MAALRAKRTDRKSIRLRVLIVEDTPTVAASLQAGLHAAGMTIDLAETGAEAIVRMASFRPDIAIVDLGLQDASAAALVEQFAAAGECGVIVLAASAEEAARNGGADDYVVKPVRMQHLAARIRAVHRRIQRPAERRPVIITVDRVLRRLIGPGGECTPLTEAELAALDTLLDAEGADVSREWLSRVALKRPLRAEDRSVDRLVLALRQKLAAQGASQRVILSVRRQGYVLPDARPFHTLALLNPRE